MKADLLVAGLAEPRQAASVELPMQ